MKHKTLTFRFLDMSRGGFARLFLLLLLPCLSAIGVKADSNGGVKFNSAVRYSQWAINSRANDFYANTTKCGMATIKDGEVSNSSFGKSTLDYVPGLVAKSMIEAADYYQDFDWSKPWFLSVKEYGDKYYESVEKTGGSLDNLNAVKLYIGLYNNINATEKDKNNAKAAISSALTGLVAHDKSYSIPSGTLAGDAVVGGWFHKTAYNNQMWLDGAYMGSALLAQIVNFNGTGSNVFGSTTTTNWDMVFKQLNIVWNMCWNSTDKLMYHAFEANAGTGTSNSHADTWAGLNGKTKPYTFHSAAYWGRANAWYLMALVDVLEAMQKAGQENTTNYTTLKQHLADLAAGIAARQDATTGGWYQVMDKDASFTASSYNSNWNGKPASVTNYIETSATAIFAAAYFKAVRLGLLSTSPYDYKTIAKNAFEGLVNNYTYLDKNGDMQIWGSCRSAGLGGGTGTEYAAGGKKYRNGSNEYYLLGYDVPMVEKSEGITEGKVLGGFIMAATEYERAYQNQDSKQILFAKDLAQNYDFSTTAGTLDATAYGDGTVSYQWYKNGSAIADATSATYTPTESGNYYCIATSATNSRSAGSNTIQTSTTTVTTANTDNDSTDNNNGGSENGTTTGNIFSYTIKTTEKDANTPYGAEGGTVTLGAENRVDTQKGNGYKLDGEFGKSVYIKIALSGTNLQEGDIIKISASSSKTGKGGLVAYTGTTTGSSSVSLGNMTQRDETISYTVTASDILNGLSTFYIYRKTNESTYIKSISITRPVKKYTVSATAGTGGSVSIKNGSSEVTSGTEVEANASVTFTATPNEGYEFVNWTDASSNEVSTNATYTTTVSAAISLRANFKAKTPVDPTVGEVIYNFTTSTSVGTTTDGTNCTSTNGIIKFSSNFSANDGKYITIKPSTGGFKAGDVITLNGYCDSKNLSGVIIYSDVKGNSIFKSNILATSTAGGSEFTYTIEKDCDALYLGRYGGGTTCLTSLQVNRPASSSNKTRLTASFERNADVVVNTTKTVTLPTLTVKAGKNILAANQYDVVYKSNAENVATLSDNTITIKNLGIATITATVTPKDANTYEGTTATYQLSVKAPSPLNVSVMDVTINTTDAEVEQPVIKVYGDNDKLLKAGQDYTLSYAVSGDNVTVDNETGKFSVKKNAEKTAFIKGTSIITVTATPTPSLGSNYTKGTLQFSYSVSEGKIKPVFLESFKGITINLQPGKSKTIAVPLIYNGEDVSSYFTYTYTIDPAISGLTIDGSKLTFTTPSATKTYTVKVNADAATIGDVNYGDVYDKPAEISFTLNVDSKYKTISVTPDPTSIKMDAGTTHDAPDLTVLLTETKETLDDTKYSTSWFSTSPGVVKVDASTGKIEAVSEGKANIRVVVTGENLESTTALITVEVDDPAMYRVKGPETGVTYGNHTTMWNQDKTLFVTLGGWMFPNNGTPDTNILDQNKKDPETLSNSYQWDTQSSKAKWKLTGFDYYVSGNNSKNARQENGSNAMPETTTIGSADFKTYTKEVKDPMFNVPCSGSFLVFNPKTNGKVTAHIFQNGVFDAKTTKKNGTETKEYQYRPQRRVFVMDEAGNFVTSTAHIESTNGKPTGGVYDLTKYGWDLNGGKAPTETEVASHFDGLESFVMSKDGFKNNVYPSALSDAIMPNKAIANHSGDKSAQGWCVLADSPVTYTFNVKAGKSYYLYNFGSKIGFYGFSFDEDETKPVEDVVSYDDNATNTIKTTKDGHVAKVTVNRKMTAGIWTTCVLPFSLNVHQVDAIFGNTYSIGNENGTQILYFDRVENGKVYFVRHAYNTIVANKPFLIKPSKDVESISTAAATEYPYVTIEATKNENGKPDDWCTGNDYTWASSYSYGMTVQVGDGFISKDGLFKNFVGESGTLKGFRGYLKRLDTQGAKPIMLQVVSSSNVDGNNGETTGIEDLIIDADGQLMPANGKVYNINGQLVSEDANSFQSLPSGIYIINGKKYIK